MVLQKELESLLNDFWDRFLCRLGYWSKSGLPSGIRIHTFEILSFVPLPIGLLGGISLVFPSRQSANGFRKTDTNLRCASQQSHYHPLFLLQLRYLAKISPTSGNCGKLTALRCPIAVCSLLLYLIQRFIVLCKTFVQSHLVANHCIKNNTFPHFG